jgi:homoserine dehydrogenase
MHVADESGVLATIAHALEQFDISIESMLQKPTEDASVAKLLFSTHHCQEKQMQEAIEALSRLEVVKGEIAMMRIEK